MALEDIIPRLAKNFSVKVLLADAGYDTEKSLELLRYQFKIDPLIPPLRSPNNKAVPKGPERRKMFYAFKDSTPEKYKQRWQVETVMSMLKRNLTSALSSRSFHAQNREIQLLAITHNLAVVRIAYLFYGAHSCPSLLHVYTNVSHPHRAPE